MWPSCFPTSLCTYEDTCSVQMCPGLPAIKSVCGDRTVLGQARLYSPYFAMSLCRAGMTIGSRPRLTVDVVVMSLPMSIRIEPSRRFWPCTIIRYGNEALHTRHHGRASGFPRQLLALLLHCAVVHVCERPRKSVKEEGVRVRIYLNNAEQRSLFSEERGFCDSVKGNRLPSALVDDLGRSPCCCKSCQ